jgi:hypothetical protein
VACSETPSQWIPVSQDRFFENNYIVKDPTPRLLVMGRILSRIMVIDTGQQSRIQLSIR